MAGSVSRHKFQHARLRAQRVDGDDHSALLLSATGTYILRHHQPPRACGGSACGWVSEKVEALSLNEQAGMRMERIEDYRAQMRRLRVRLGLLQNAVISLYSAALTFILCSVAIGVAAISLKLYWLPVVLGLLGACMLLLASITLIREARHAVSDLELESAFLRKVVRHHAEQ